MSDYSELKRLAEAFPDYEWDSNQTPFFNGPSGESLGGDPTGFYCVYGHPFEIEDETYDGVTLIESCPEDQSKFICEAKRAVLELIAEVEGLRAQHGRDSAELRSLCQARDYARKERDQLKADNEALRRDSERLDWLCGQSRPVVEGQTMSNPEGELAGYDWGVFGACGTVREAIDYAMSKGDQS